MILINPGGPGQSGIESLLAMIEYIRPRVGGKFDVVAWEPRGIGYSIPLIDCSKTAMVKRHHSRSGSGSSKSPPTPKPDGFLEEQYADDTKVEGACQGGPGAADAYMNTGTIVRDMVAILDSYSASSAAAAVSDASLLNYWGFSYGTFIGQTFASMFPNRIGRVVLDGVEEPYGHIAGTGVDSLSDTDDAFLTFFYYCSRAGAACKSLSSFGFHCDGLDRTTYFTR